MNPAPVWDFMGPRSPAWPEFNPFWSKEAETNILVGMQRWGDGEKGRSTWQRS